MSGERSRPPVEFADIEWVKRGPYRVTGRVMVPEVLYQRDTKPDKVNILDQPPFYWIWESVDWNEDLFLEQRNGEEIGDGEILARMVRGVARAGSRFAVTRPKPSDSSLRVFVEELAPVVAEKLWSDEEKKSGLIATGVKVIRFLDKFPDVWKYLKEYWLGSGTSLWFDKAGWLVPEHVRGFKVNSYAGYAVEKERGRRVREWGAMMEGLSELLPDSRAVLPEEERPREVVEVLYPIFMLALLND